MPPCRSPVLGDAICRVPKLIFARGGVCGTTAPLAALLRLAGGIARAGFTCRLRGSIHAEIVRIIIIYIPEMVMFLKKKCPGEDKNVHFLFSQVTGQKVTRPVTSPTKRCRQTMKMHYNCATIRGLCILDVDC